MVFAHVARIGILEIHLGEFKEFDPSQKACHSRRGEPLRASRGRGIQDRCGLVLTGEGGRGVRPGKQEKGRVHRGGYPPQLLGVR